MKIQKFFNFKDNHNYDYDYICNDRQNYNDRFNYNTFRPSVTIHDDTYLHMYIFLGDVCKKKMKPLCKVKGFFNRTSWKVSDVPIVRDTWVLVANDTSNHPVAVSLRSVPQESWS